MIAAGPGNPADCTLQEEFSSWKCPLFPWVPAATKTLRLT